MNPDVPSGDTPEVVQRYYNYLYQNYLSHLNQNYYIHWDTILWVLLWIVILAGGFYAFTRWQRYTRQQKEPYPVESYNGYIQEGNGPVGPFLTIFFIVMIIWLIAMTISNLLVGQIY
ncbi:MAG: hypothetical protein ACK2UW_20195 [Anaerolineales bacterium]|jgi:hypothetical protein